MQQWTVRDVMTNQVLTVSADARPAEVIAMITTHDVSALAVVDRFDAVIGVLTRTDVLKSMTFGEQGPRGRLARWRSAPPEIGWHATSAREMMTAPPVTIAPDATIAQAGRRMHRSRVNRLLVTDHRRHLVGIIAAADLLKVFGRSDEVIANDVRARMEPVSAADVLVGVNAGVVTLIGRVPDRAKASLLEDLAGATPGVADVVTELRVDAPAAAPDRQAVDA
jgi:CBS domain-containing protein